MSNVPSNVSLSAGTIMSRVKRELFNPLKAQIETVVELLKEQSRSRTIPDPNMSNVLNNNCIEFNNLDMNNAVLNNSVLPQDQVPQAVIEILPQPAPAISHTDIQVQEPRAITRPPGYLTYTEVPTSTTYSYVNAFPQQGSAFVVNSVSCRTSPTFATAPLVASSERVITMPINPVVASQGGPTLPR